MDSIGEKLRSLREARKLSIREVAKETNIAPTYIEALEAEEFDKFPGETYIIGFLRNYSEFLRIDPEEVIQAYKGHKIGESVTPLEELTRPTRGEIGASVGRVFDEKRNIIYAVAAVVVIVVGVLLYSNFAPSNIDYDTEDATEDTRNRMADEENSRFDDINNVQITNNKGMTLAFKNEAVQFMVGTREYLFVVREFRDKQVLIELHPDKKVETLTLDVPKELLFKDTPEPVTVTLRGLTDERAKLLIDLGDAATEAEETENSNEENFRPETTDTTTVVSQNEQNLRIIFEAEFADKTYMELYLDGQKKVSGMVMPGTRRRWEANRLLQMKVGNAGGVKVRINGRDYTFGLPGQVANKKVEWRKDPNNPNMWHVEVKDWQ